MKLRLYEGGLAQCQGLFGNPHLRYGRVGSGKQLNPFLARRLSYIKTVSNVAHPDESGSEHLKPYSTIEM